MFISEKSALGRVLLISRQAYSAVKNGEHIDNLVALLDSFSAILSHAEDEKAPVSKLFGKFKREIRSSNREFYNNVKLFFGKTYPAPDFDIALAKKHIPAIIYANDLICSKAVKGEFDKVKSMCSAMDSYPPYIFGEFSALSDSQFFDLVFGYYPKIYEEEFMEKMRYLFE